MAKDKLTVVVRALARSLAEKMKGRDGKEAASRWRVEDLEYATPWTNLTDRMNRNMIHAPFDFRPMTHTERGTALRRIEEYRELTERIISHDELIVGGAVHEVRGGGWWL